MKFLRKFNEGSEDSDESLKTSDDNKEMINIGSDWDDIFERLSIVCNNFEDFWKECEKIKSEYQEPKLK